MNKQTIRLATGAVALLSLAHASEPTSANPAPSASADSGATTDSVAPAAKPQSSFDRIWSYGTLYHNAENPVLQKLQFTGRYQLDYVQVDEGDFEDLDTRRWRMGGKATLFQNFTLHGEADLYPDRDDYYQRMTDAYVAWSTSESLELTLGKQSAAFTMDGSTSSKELLAIDRSNLANNLWFTEEYIPGVSAGGTTAGWNYFLGLFSAGARNKGLGEFDGGLFTLTTVGYNFAKALDVKKAALNFNYVYNTGDEANSFTRPLENVASLNFDFDAGSWGFRTDVSGGTGFANQSDLWGAMVMPYYNLTKQLQAVVRYTYLESADDNGVRFNRYENQVVAGRGDQYEEIFVGLNYYFYKHKLKLQTGVQYADMRDQAGDGGAYSGWAWTTGLRISW
jgi:phosphate-selective porin OprO and OprP